MAYSLKKRKQLSKSSKKNKTKLRKAKKTKRTRRFRKQYGGNLNQSQIAYIEEEINGLGFTEDKKKTILDYFDKISSHVSEKSRTNNELTVLNDFFENVKSNSARYKDVQDKKEIFLVGLYEMYYSQRNEPIDLDGLLGRKK